MLVLLLAIYIRREDWGQGKKSSHNPLRTTSSVREKNSSEISKAKEAESNRIGRVPEPGGLDSWRRLRKIRTGLDCSPARTQNKALALEQSKRATLGVPERSAGGEGQLAHPVGGWVGPARVFSGAGIGSRRMGEGKPGGE
jgi:hypothetical protein